MTWLCAWRWEGGARVSYGTRRQAPQVPGVGGLSVHRKWLCYHLGQNTRVASHRKAIFQACFTHVPAQTILGISFLVLFFFFFLLQTIQLCDGILTGAKSLCVVESDIYGKISSMTRILIHVHPNMQFHAFISLMFLQLGPGFAVILFSEGALQCAIWEAVFSL